MTLRLAGIGESQVADQLGEELLRATDPIVATYARERRRRRPDLGPGPARDRRRLADRRGAGRGHGRPPPGGLADHVWAEGDTTWPDAIGAALAEREQALAVVEVGTGGSLAALLGDRDWLRFSESLAADTRDGPRATTRPTGLEHLARRAAELGEAAVGIARPRPAARRRHGASRSSWSGRAGPIASGGWCSSAARTAGLRAALAAVHILLTAIRAH